MIATIMPSSPAYALAHTFLPNTTKLKGPTTMMVALEKRDHAFFEPIWKQAFIDHKPSIYTVERDPYRIGVLDLPKPKDLGEAYFAGWVIKKSDITFARFFLLEHDYMLAKKAFRTVLTEREGIQSGTPKDTKHGEGPELTGDFAKDAVAFVDCFMELIVPTKVAAKPKWQ
jgi:hypothetical protein